MHTSLRKLVFMSSLGGISNAAILASINTGAAAADSGHKAGIWPLMLFVVSLFLFLKTQIYVTTTITAEIEAIIHRMRVRLMDHVRRSELLSIERIGRARIVAAITSDSAVLTQASNMLSFSLQAPVLIFFVGAYVAFLSFPAFVLSMIIVGFAGTMFHFRSRRLVQERAKAAEQERRLFDRVADFLDGFKEVRLNADRSNDLYDDAFEVSRNAANIKIHAQAETFKQIITAQSYMYILLGTVAFVVPQFTATLGGASITKVATALLYVVGAFFGLVQSIPVLMNANAAADRMAQLDDALQATAATEDEGVKVPTRFERIEMHDIRFRYVDRFSATTFQIGPIDFNLQAGELVFLTGGNGSGKSTFLRVLSGLYPPDSGEVLLDGMRINSHTRDAYRGLIAGIFFDYHLFKKLYGIHDADPEDIERLLRQFRLEEKTGITNGEFRTLDLSGGQRRRLALIVSLLEKRPILLLDEWTAEQDPEFRRKFYDEMLPDLMRAGTTVVVITHDDRYLDELHLPSRVIKMDEGRVVAQRSIS